MKRLTPPENVKSDPVALAKWREVIEQHAELSNEDATALSFFCLLWSDYLALRAQVKKEGVVIKDKKGSTKRNPAMLILANEETKLVALLSALLLTPKSRLRLKEPEYSELTPTEIKLGVDGEEIE